MTTFAEARDELIDALTTAGALAVADPGADTPYVLVTFDGGNATRIVAGKVLADYRLVLVGGGWETAGSAHELDVLRQTCLTVLRGLDGWQVGQLGREGGRSWAGSTYLSGDITASRHIDL
jgi:hypothetical protein